MKLSTAEGVNIRDYSQPLKDAISGCANTWNVHRLQLGRDIFKWLENSKAASRLGDYLDRVTKGTLSRYLGTRWWVIFLIVLAIVALVGSIVVACLARTTKRPRSFLCCSLCKSPADDAKKSGGKTGAAGADPDASSRRGSVNNPHNRAGGGPYNDRPSRLGHTTSKKRALLSVLSIFFCLGLIVLVVFTYVAGAQIFGGQKHASCNGYLQLYAHFHGAHELKNGERLESPVATTWGGTYKVYEELKSLEARVAPTNNPVKAKFVARRMEIEKLAYEKYYEFQNVTTQAYLLTTAHMALLDPVYKAVDAPYVPELLVGHIARQKGQIGAEMIRTSIVKGMGVTDQLLLKYADASSVMMRRAYGSVQVALATIEQINLSIAHFANEWDHLASMLKSLTVPMAIIAIVVGSVIVLLAIAYIALGLALRRAIHRDRYPTTRFRRLWRVLFVTTLVCFGVSCFISAYFFAVAAVGSDACRVVDKDLLEQGRWTMLPEAVLKPRGDNTTLDMKTVLDTCVRRDGAGNVAVSIGLDGSIAELSEDVDHAKKDMIETSGKMVSRGEREFQTTVLALGYRDVLKSHGPKSFEERFPEIRFVGLDPKPLTREGRGIIITPIAYSDAPDNSQILTQLTTFGPTIAISGADEAYKFLNVFAQEFTDAAPSDESKRFPQQFCSAFAQSMGVDCTLPGLDPNKRVTDLSKISRAEANRIGELVTGPLLNPWYWRGMHSMFVRPKVKLLLQDLRAAEAVRELNLLAAEATTPKDPKVTSCEGLSPCTYNALRERDMARFTKYGEQVHKIVKELCDIFDGYVYDFVLPEMEKLVADANALTDDSNCQMLRTSLDFAVAPALCKNLFPAVFVAAWLWLLIALLLLWAAWYAWHWLGRILDIAQRYPTEREYRAEKEHDLDLFDYYYPETRPSVMRAFAGDEFLAAQPGVIAAATTQAAHPRRVDAHPAGLQCERSWISHLTVSESFEPQEPQDPEDHRRHVLRPARPAPT